MKVAMIARSTLYRSPGGDTVQVCMTAKYLRLLGISVDVRLTSEGIDYSHYDLLHFFNIIRPDDILHHVNKTQLPCLVSTIFVDFTEYERECRKGIFRLAASVFDGNQLEYMKAMARYIKNGDAINSARYVFTGHRASVRYVAQKCQMLLPNSNSEYRRFCKIYGTERPYQTVPNAIDESIFNEDVQPNNKYTGHVLCVGRFEGRKNQLNLIKALEGTGIPLTLIGKPSPNHGEYYEECRKQAAMQGNVQFIEHIEHAELAAIYKAAKVHVLPSWFETTGLSSLEAGVMDCNIVVTKKGDTEEYFGNLAYYCEPNNIKSIKEAVLNAYEAPLNTSLKEKIRTEYTWEKAADKTLTAYRTVLN